VRHDLYLRWLRLKRHLRSCGEAPRVRHASAARRTFTARDGGHPDGAQQRPGIGHVAAPLPTFAPDPAT
jgi:hypothetical protein